MSKKEYVLDELILMADVFGDGITVETDTNELSARCGLTIGGVRRSLYALQRKSKIRIVETGRFSIAGGHERLKIQLMV